MRVTIAAAALDIQVDLRALTAMVNQQMRGDARVGGAVQGSSRQQYVVSRDGQRFLMNTVRDGAPAAPITLIVNWNPRDRRGS